MNFNLFGIILFIAFLPEKLIMTFFPPIKRIHHKEHKQIKIIEIISELGLLFFGVFSVFDFGYKSINLVVEIVWIICMIVLFLLFYSLIIRYLTSKRYEEALYDKVIIYSPLSIVKSLIYFLSGILLVNPFVIVFSIIFSASHIYINVKKNFE